MDGGRKIRSRDLDYIQKKRRKKNRTKRRKCRLRDLEGEEKRGSKIDKRLEIYFSNSFELQSGF